MNNNKIKTVLGVIILVLFIAISAMLYKVLSDRYKPDNQLQITDQTFDTNEQSTADPDNKRYPAPDFTVYDLQGNKVKLSDYFGKPIVLNFWASWCPPCKEEMPFFDEVYKEVKEEVMFIMVDLSEGQRETQEKGQKYVEEQGFSFPVFFDNDQNAAIAYGIISIPTTIFIDSEGYMKLGYQGAIDKDTLLDGIDLIK